MKLATWSLTNQSEYTACEILFGVKLDCEQPNAINELENLTIMIGKWYINKTKIDNRNLSFRQFLGKLRLKLEIYDAMFREPHNIDRVDTESEIKIKMKQFLTQIKEQ